MRTRSPRRSRTAVVAAAVTVAVAIGVVAVLGDRTGGEARTGDGVTAAPAAGPTAPSDRVDIDLAPLSDADALAACAGDGFEGPGVEVLYAVRQQSPDGEVPVVLLRNADGALRMCDGRGPDNPAQWPVPQPAPDEPVVHLAGRAAWDCTGRRLDRHDTTQWLAVAAPVATVQQRFRVDGVAGPWFTTGVVDGYAHLHAWLDGPLPDGTRVAVQHRVLDADGEPLEVTGRADHPTDVPWCDAGDVQIG